MLLRRSCSTTVLVIGFLGLALWAFGPGIAAASTAAKPTAAKPTVSKNPPLVSLQKENSPRVGSMLADPLDGTSATLWTGAPKLSVQWYRCVTSKSCRAIHGATRDDYTVATADVDHFLQAWVTATNGSGSTVVKSPLSSLIRSPLVPSNTKLPEISPAGIAPLPGAGLHAFPGSWTGAPTHYIFQWLACTSASKCVVIQTGVLSLPTSSTMVTSTADLGDAIEVEVEAANKYGSSPEVTSPPTKPVAF